MPKEPEKPLKTTKSGWGGSRSNSGRNRKAVTHAGAIKAAEKRCADLLPSRLDIMVKLSDGGIEVTEDTYEPAGMVEIEYVHTVTDDKGNEKAIKAKKLAFPEIAKEDPETPVLVKRVIKTSGPDREATQYLINRVMGTPTNKHEFEGLSDAELIETAKTLFGRVDSSGDSPTDS